MTNPSLSRREILKSFSVMGACVPWPFTTYTKIRPEPWVPDHLCDFDWPTGQSGLERKPLQELNASDRCDLKKAYQLWQQNPEDSWGRYRQSKFHFDCCSQPWSIHSSPANLLVWHRAFLFFHERNLAAALGQPSFRLPYWDWDSQECVTVAPFCKSETANVYAALNPALKWHFPDSLVVPGITTLISMPQEQLLASLLDIHHKIHYYLADDMIEPNSSAQDPIFYTFHANFDRIWAALAKNPASAAISANGLSPMYFFDLQTQIKNPNAPGAGWVLVKPGDFLDYSRLGYSYDLSNIEPAFQITEYPAGARPTRSRRPTEIDQIELREFIPAKRFIAIYDIELPGTPGAAKWQVSAVVRGGGDNIAAKASAEFETFHEHTMSAKKQKSYPYLLVDVISDVKADQFNKADVKLLLTRSGQSPKPLKARKVVFQLWTRKLPF